MNHYSDVIAQRRHITDINMWTHTVVFYYLIPIEEPVAAEDCPSNKHQTNDMFELETSGLAHLFPSSSLLHGVNYL